MAKRIINAGFIFFLVVLFILDPIYNLITLLALFLAKYILYLYIATANASYGELSEFQQQLIELKNNYKKYVNMLRNIGSFIKPVGMIFVAIIVVVVSIVGPIISTALDKIFIAVVYFKLKKIGTKHNKNGKWLGIFVGLCILALFPLPNFLKLINIITTDIVSSTLCFAISRIILHIFHGVNVKIIRKKISTYEIIAFPVIIFMLIFGRISFFELASSLFILLLFSIFNSLYIRIAKPNIISGLYKIRMPKYFELALDIDGYDYLLLLNCCKNIDELESSANDILLTDPKNKFAIMNLSYVYLVNKKYDELIEFSTKYINDKIFCTIKNIECVLSVLHNNRGVAYEAKEMYAEAIKDFDKVAFYL